MPYTVEDYKRELREEIKKEIWAELTTEELLKRLSPEERLKGLTREEIEAYMKKLSKSN